MHGELPVKARRVEKCIFLTDFRCFCRLAAVLRFLAETTIIITFVMGLVTLLMIMRLRGRNLWIERK